MQQLLVRFFQNEFSERVIRWEDQWVFPAECVRRVVQPATNAEYTSVVEWVEESPRLFQLGEVASSYQSRLLRETLFLDDLD